MLKSILILSLVATTLPAMALAADYRPQPSQAAVNTRGYDLANPKDVRDLHNVLRRSAKAVCDSQDKQLAAQASDAQCARESLDRAVAAVGQPLLSAYNAGKPITSDERVLALSGR
jgi:UrcA family protein